MKDDIKQAQWKGFIEKTRLTNTPTSFEDVAAAVKVFLQPLDLLKEHIRYDVMQTLPQRCKILP